MTEEHKIKQSNLESENALSDEQIFYVLKSLVDERDKLDVLQVVLQEKYFEHNNLPFKLFRKKNFYINHK